MSQSNSGTHLIEHFPVLLDIEKSSERKEAGHLFPLGKLRYHLSYPTRVSFFFLAGLGSQH